MALPMQLFYTVFSLPIRALDWASVRTVQLVGIKATAEHASTYTEEELRRLVDISRESGHLRAEERRLIHRVFEFSDTVVREAMVPRTEMAAIPDTCDLEQITKAFDQHRYSRLPVYRESFDDVIGFIHSKDVMPYLLHPEKFKLEDVLQPPLYVVDTARLEHVLRQMQKAKMHFGFVVDEHGGLEGVITLEDLLEEIVGDISDEHDEEVNEQITQIDETHLCSRWRIGRARSEPAFETFGAGVGDLHDCRRFSDDRSWTRAQARRSGALRWTRFQGRAGRETTRDACEIGNSAN